MHYIKYVLSFILLLALSGCNDSEPHVDYSNQLAREDVTKAKVYFDQVLEATLNEAKKQKDPYEAYSLLLNAYYGADANREPIVYKNSEKSFVIRQSKFSVISTLDESFGNGQSYSGYNDLKTLTKNQEALNDLFNYLNLSLQYGNKKAFIDLYDSKKSYFKNDTQNLKQVEQLQIKYAPAFMTMAESLSVGDPLDDELILLYAYQNNKGFFYTKNSAKAVDYYQKLYPTNKTVALYIIGVYLEINDFENAYFWKVRCIDTCANMYDTLYAPIAKRTKVDDIFRERLNSTQFKEIEKASNDPMRTSFK